MNSEKTLVHGGCTNCGYVMMHVEVVKGCLQCPNCGEWLRVSVKNRGYSAHPASEEDIKEAILMRNKYARECREVVTRNISRL
jgi:predicted  nucleic acid-binding Zn-ribbon protein